MNAPTMIQNNISNILNPYSKGCGGCTGAGFPPKPVTTSVFEFAVAPNPELLIGLELLLNPDVLTPVELVGWLLLNPPLFVTPAATVGAT